MLQIISSKIETTNSPICHITVGGVDLHGMLLSPSSKSKKACLFIHGTGGVFYGDDWTFKVADTFIKNGISFLTANHRGSTSLSSYPPHGAALEKFNGCADDIDGWLSFLKRKGFTKFVLAGHSMGTEKIVHYMSEKNKDIISVILLSFADSFGTTKDYLKTRFDKVMSEAKHLKSSGKGDTFLTTDWLSHGGILPTSAETFIDLFSDGSALSKALPLRSNRLEKYSRIKVPILAVIGDQEEYTSSTLEYAINLMRTENPNSTVKQLKNCDHDFTGKVSDLCRIIDCHILQIP